MSERPASAFQHAPDPDNPGWTLWGGHDTGLFSSHFDPIRVRADGEGKARVRCIPGDGLKNYSGNVHGGAMAGFVDIALFAGMWACGVADEAGATTVDLSIQYQSVALVGEPLDVEVEIMRETGRMLFMRGLVTQQAGVTASFLATIRKRTRKN
ncbi:MAG: phenylacetic acid degradation protein [Sphingobium sp.]|nr:MAG: phenylacetic acid degradation protein [Sphingobium sp.]